ncbi:MAG: hypothetical protein ABI456_00395 [Ktedonobacteraceae bacterium]
MDDALRNAFLRNDTPAIPPEARTLLRYKNSLENMRHLFLYGMDLRTVTTRHIDTWEADLRKIMGGIVSLHRTANVEKFLISTDAVLEHIGKANHCLYRVSHLLGQQGDKNKKLLYQIFNEVCVHLFNAIEQFKNLDE